MREPQLLPLDAQPRRLWLPVAALLLLGVIGVFIWQKFLVLPQPAGNSFAALNQGAQKLPSKQAQAEVNASSVASPAISPSPAASQAASTNTAIPASLSTTIESQSSETPPATRAAITAASKEEWKQELGRIFHAWAMSATRGNWQQHAKFYADSVQYLREGAISPAAVLTRKQKVFGEAESYQLQFSQMPMVNFQNHGKAVEAEIIFDKQWVINKGRNVTEGKSSSALRLRREPLGWRIIGEKHLQTYYHRTRKVVAK
jgi:cytoskeletal protein RodZ